MDLESFKKENEYLKEEIKQRSELEKIRMNRIFRLCDEVKEWKTAYRKLQNVIENAIEVVDEALSLDDTGEICCKLNEIKNILED